jgi:hypothetical protein
MSNLSKSKLGKFVATIVSVSSISAILTTSNKAEAIPLYPNDLVNNQVYRLQMEKSAPNGSPVTLNITQQYGFKNGGLVNTWIGSDGDSRFKYLTNGYGINFQRENSNYSISVKDLNVTPGNTINSYTSGFGRYQDWNLEKVGGDTYLFHWRTDLDTNLCLDIRGFGQGQQLNNQTPVVWNCDRNNVNQRIRVIKQGQVNPSPVPVPAPIPAPAPNRPANSLINGTIMLPGTSIKSNNQCFSLNAQTDGNLVLYRQSNGQALWDTKTSGRNVKQTIFQNDGNLVIYNTSNQAVWASNTDRRGGTKLTVQDDGNFVMYNAQNQVVWPTNTVTSCNAPALVPAPQPTQRDSQRKINDFVNQWNEKTGVTRYDLVGNVYNGQCVTLIARYLQDHYGASKTLLSLDHGRGTARKVGNQLFTNDFWPVEKAGDPQPGSIISFPNAPNTEDRTYCGGKCGHVALVVNSRRNGNILEVDILESNALGQGANSKVTRDTINISNSNTNNPSATRKSGASLGSGVQWVNPKN